MATPFNNASETLDFSFTTTAKPVTTGLDFTEDKVTEEIETPPEVTDTGVEDIFSPTPVITPTTETPDFGNVEEEVVPNPTVDYLTVINKLSDEGIIAEAYDDFNPEQDADEEVLIKLVKHNTEVAKEQALEEFIDGLSPLAQRVLSFDLTARGANVEEYLKTLINENNIKSLSADNEFDREKIVRTFYQDENWSLEEVEDKVSELKEAGLLEKEARRLKPKLDEKAEKIAIEQENSQKALRAVEDNRKQYYYGKLRDSLSTGTVAGMKLSKEDAEKVVQLLVVEDVPIKLPEGRVVKMSYLESEIFKHKYSTTGSVETLILAGLLLTDKDKFFKEFSKLAKTEVTNTFIKDHKYNIAAKAGVPNNQKQEQNTASSKEIPWNFLQTKK